MNDNVGTLYRRFADRESLVRAVFRDVLETVAVEMTAAIAEEPTGWDALTRIMRQSAWLSMSVQIRSPLVSEVVRHDEEMARRREELVDMIDGAVRRAHDEGTLRRDVGVGDIAMLFASLAKQTHAVTAEAAAIAPARVLAIVIEAYAPRRPTNYPAAR